jgi:hypothetical protein
MKVHQQITNDIVDFSQKQNDYSVSSTFPSVSQALYINHSSKRTLDSTILTSSERIKKVSTRIRPVDNTKMSLTFSSFDVHTDQKRRAGSRRGVYFLTRN